MAASDGAGEIAMGNQRMTLSAYDMADLDRLAATHADAGKRHAWRAYTGHAIAAGWAETPAWVDGRNAFVSLWRRHRAAYRAAMVSLQRRYAETPPAGLYEGERA
jgi:hypothetical protein